MRKILLYHQGRAYLPELHAYQEYFSSTKKYRLYNSMELEGAWTVEDFDLVWCFMGMDRKKDQVPRIHEYASLSTGSLPRQKNMLKKLLNKKPAARVFLNEYVCKEMAFHDGVPAFYRDMGVAEAFLNSNQTKKEYDIVYVGNISKARESEEMIHLITSRFPGHTLLLVGQADDDIYQRYKSHESVTFTGRLPYSEIPVTASKAIYGLSYIPDRYPYNMQTSTKLMEYAALGLKIISNPYFWVNEFERRHQGRFYRLTEAQGPSLENFPFITPDVTEFRWQSIIEKSGIEEFLDHFFSCP